MRNILLSVLSGLFVFGCDNNAHNEPAKLPPKIEHKPRSTVLPFDAKAEKVPLGFVSINPAEFYDVLRNIPGDPIKGEFETTSDFKKRVASTKRDIRPLSFDAYYAFHFGSDFVHYDADKQMYYRESSCTDYSYKQGWASYIFCDFHSHKENSQMAIGRNAFGVEKQYEITDEVRFDLLLDRRKQSTKKLFKRDEPSTLREECHVSVEKAKSINKADLAFLLIAKIPTAKIEYIDSHYRTPKITDHDPKEGMLYHKGVIIEVAESICYLKSTGEMLSRIKLI